MITETLFSTIYAAQSWIEKFMLQQGSHSGWISAQIITNSSVGFSSPGQVSSILSLCC